MAAKFEEVDHKRDKALLFLIGKKFEQGGRDLVQAAKNISDTPGEYQRIIEIIREPMTRKKDFRSELDKPKVENQIKKAFIVYAVEYLNETYHSLQQYEEYFKDDDDDDLKLEKA